MIIPQTSEQNEFVKDKRRFIMNLVLCVLAVLVVTFAFVLAVLPTATGDAELKRNAQTGCYAIASAIVGYVVGQYQKG